MTFEVINADCIDAMRAMPESSVDAIVTDPPYGLEFMGKDWDRGVPGVHFWQEMLRVLKPGGHLLAFSGSRTYHRMVCAIEDAGFEIRDQIMWVYGSGFPKSLDVSKAIDKAAGAEREVVATIKKLQSYGHEGNNCFGDDIDRGGIMRITAPATDAARQWQGWGTALKPAHEPIVVARKPLIGTVAENVLQHGTGALNIDGCRVPSGPDHAEKCASVVGLASNRNGNAYGEWAGECTDSFNAAGRWPANLIHDGSEEVVALFPDSAGSGGSLPNVKITGYGDGIGTGKSEYFGGPRTKVDAGSGSAARFFYCAKASKRDRDEGLDGFAKKVNADWPQNLDGNDARGASPRANNHPTVKPTDLMRYLCRLVTPPGGLILDPFTGSGSTGKAAVLEGFRFIGVEKEAEYLEIARARILHAAGGDLV